MSERQPANRGRNFSYRSSCERKVWFTSYSSAKRAAANLCKIEGEEPGVITAYQCRYCGHWHVGHRQ